MKKNKKLLECLFGHHDFFTEGCVRQCKRCKVVQLYSNDGWVKVNVDDVGDFDLKTITELSPDSLMIDQFPQNPIIRWLEYWASATTDTPITKSNVTFCARVSA